MKMKPVHDKPTPKKAGKPPKKKAKSYGDMMDTLTENKGRKR